MKEKPSWWSIIITVVIRTKGKISNCNKIIYLKETVTIIQAQKRKQQIKK